MLIRDRFTDIAILSILVSVRHVPVLYRYGLTLNMQAYCLLVHRSLSGNAPGYLADDCQLVADARFRQLRSVDTRTLVVSRTRSSFGDRTFAAAGPQVWNSLPPNLRLRGLSYGKFRRLLKNRTVRPRHSVNCFLTARNRNILNYLLTFSPYGTPTIQFFPH